MNIYQNVYVDTVWAVSNKSKYAKWYCNIVSNCLSRAASRKEAARLLSSVHGHHIIPVSFQMGGEKDNNNIAFMSHREHFICHWLLTKCFEGDLHKKMCWAFGNMRNWDRQYKSARYAHNTKRSHTREALEKYKLTMLMKYGVENGGLTSSSRAKASERMKSPSNPVYHISENTKELHRKIQTGIMDSLTAEERSAKYGNFGECNPMFGNTHTEESRNKMRAANLKYTYRLTSPIGIVYKTDNLFAFCKQFNLNRDILMKFTNKNIPVPIPTYGKESRLLTVGWAIESEAI